MTIFLDMDGVLVDFNKGLEDFNVYNTCNQYHARPKSEWTPLQIKLDREVQDCMNTPGFFLNLPIMPGARDLWETAGEPSVLTASPKSTKAAKRCGDEKREWIRRNFGDIPNNRFVYCLRSEKALYATTHIRVKHNEPCNAGTISQWNPFPNILVDDLEENILKWGEAGGLPILYKTMEQSITDLRSLIEQRKRV